MKNPVVCKCLEAGAAELGVKRSTREYSFTSKKSFGQFFTYDENRLASLLHLHISMLAQASVESDLLLGETR